MALPLAKLEVKQSMIRPESNNELKKTISSVSCGNSDSGIEDNADDQISPIATNSSQQKQNQNGIRRRGSIWNIFSRKSKKDHRFGENNRPENLNISNESRYQKSQNVDLSLPPSSHHQKLRPKLSICSTSTNSSIAGHGQISSRLSHGSATIGSFTSDLGDSVPSTPVSTISSAGFTEIPGTIGLHNLGNTCYFNAVIQCLAHIDVISEYFVMEHFMADLTTRNHHNHSLKMRHRQHSDSNNNDLGQLTYMIGLLIKSICFGENYTRQLLEEVLEVVRFHNRSYNINEQQDAQEIFMWLINQIHSESCSNTAPKRRSIKSKDIKKKKQSNEEEQAVASFASFTKYKQSYIQGLFLSQYQSSIPCLRCGKSSSTFDPYINLSLEIPSKPKSVLYTTVVSRKQIPGTVPVTNKTIGNVAVTIKPPRMVRYGFEFQRKGTLHELRTEIVDQSGIQDFVIVEITTHGVKRILQNDNPLSILPNDEKSLYAVELSKDVHKADEAETRSNEIVLVVSNVERRNRTNISFGEPSVLCVSDQMSFKRLQTLIRKQMETNLQEHLTKVIKENPICLGLRIVNNNNDDSQSVNTKPIFLKNDVGYPLLQPNILESMTYDDNIQKTCLYLVAEWESSANHWFMSKFRYPISVTDDKSCSRMRERANEQFVVDIHDCLKLQTKEEKLMEVGAWKCQFCQQEQSGITKKMSLWSLPDVLVLHLKRFDQIQTFKDKARTLVRFPIHGLDLSSYVATTTSSTKDHTELLDSRFQKESIRLRYQAPPQNESQCLYDLKAVCNHIGSDLNQGHYTASCYNSFNRNWYNFDDRTVNSLSENEVVNSDAYILFYQRRELSDRVPEKVSMSLRNKERSKRIQDHWATEDIDKVE